MTTIIVEDIERNQELTKTERTAVSGGTGTAPGLRDLFSQNPNPTVSSSSSDSGSMLAILKLELMMKKHPRLARRRKKS